MNTRGSSRRRVAPFPRVLLVCLTIASCTSLLDAPPADGNGRTFDVQPDTLTLAVGDSAIFTATAIASNGKVVEVDVQWSIAGDTGATVTGKGKGKKEGHFKPRKSGRWSVIGEDPDGRTDTSQVDVVESTAFSHTSLEQVVSLPDTAVLRYEVFGHPNRRVVCIDLQVVAQGGTMVMNQMSCPSDVSVASDTWLIDPVTDELVDPQHLAAEIVFLIVPPAPAATLVQPYVAASAGIGDPEWMSLLHGGDR